MANARPMYHIPQTRLWNWRLVSESFVRMELQRTRNALADLGKDEARVDTEVMNIEQEIRGKWADANATVMRAFEARLTEILKERRRLAKVGTRLNQELKNLHEIGVQHGWKL